MPSRKNNFIDDEEKKQMEIWNDVDVAKFESDTENIKQLKSIAKNYVKKHETKMNIRISEDELEKIKQRAELEGLKYQTFIKSVLHKYITGQLVEDKSKIAS
jgi:predicted DNA binding CopG/RHH family protein